MNMAKNKELVFLRTRSFFRFTKKLSTVINRDSKRISVTQLLNRKHSDYMESPDRLSLLLALKQLFLIGAVEDSGHITKVGETMTESYPSARFFLLFF